MGFKVLIQSLRHEMDLNFHTAQFYKSNTSRCDTKAPNVEGNI